MAGPVMTGADAVRMIGELSVLAQRYHEVSGQLVEGAKELTTLVNTLPDLLVDYKIGGGVWVDYPNLLTDPELIELADQVGRGDLILVSLYSDEDSVASPNRQLARVVFVDIENIKAPLMDVVRIEDDESDKSKWIRLTNPRKNIWSKKPYRKIGGV